MAFMIFVMGHMLAPSTKYDYATIAFWGLAKTKNISQFNWYEYVLQAPYTSTRKMQKKMSPEPTHSVPGIPYHFVRGTICVPTRSDIS
jgi:hypothetical protein